MNKKQANKVIEYISKNPLASSKEVADAIGSNFNTVRAEISSLCKAGRIERHGYHNNYKYTVATKELDRPMKMYSCSNRATRKPKTTAQVLASIRSSGGGVWAVMAAQLIKD